MIYNENYQFNKGATTVLCQLIMVLSITYESLATEADAPTNEADAPTNEADAPTTEADAPTNDADPPTNDADPPTNDADPSTNDAYFQRFDQRQYWMKDMDRCIQVKITIFTNTDLSFMFFFNYRQRQENEELIERFCYTLESLIRDGLTYDDAALVNHLTNGYQVCRDLINVSDE